MKEHITFKILKYSKINKTPGFDQLKGKSDYSKGTISRFKRGFDDASALQMATNTTRNISLPISRVKTIMKSSPEVENISNESIHLVARATELFIQYLAKESFMYGGSNNELQYRDIAEIVDRDQKFEFLRELIPQKITVREYKDLLRKKVINLC